VVSLAGHGADRWRGHHHFRSDEAAREVEEGMSSEPMAAVAMERAARVERTGEDERIHRPASEEDRERLRREAITFAGCHPDLPIGVSLDGEIRVRGDYAHPVEEGWSFYLSYESAEREPGLIAGGNFFGSIEELVAVMLRCHARGLQDQIRRLQLELNAIEGFVG
jgi:hypothetical protein